MTVREDFRLALKNHQPIHKEHYSTLYWANIYLDHGFSVIPLRPKEKIPAITWKEFQTRRPTREEIEEWFSKGNFNIGIVTGKISGIIVVDFDSEEAVKYAKGNGFPPCPKVKSWKGYHYYYIDSKDIEIRNFQKRDDLPGIDIRGEGGYIVAPPSIHPSGHVYEWVSGESLWTFDNRPLEKFPTCLLIKTQSEKTPVKELFTGVKEGKRNDSLFRIACGLSKNGLSLEECLSLALTWNERNSPPLGESEVKSTVKGVYEKYHEQDSVFQFYDPIYRPKTKKLDLSNFDPFSVLKTGAEILKMDIKMEWVIDKLLPKESITLFHGKGGIGKTWLSLQLAEAVSRGEPFMGLSILKTPVYYIDFENSIQVLGERIKKLDITDVLFWHNSFKEKPPKIDTPEWEKYKLFPPGLLIIDTFRAFQLQDENDSKYMATVMGRLKDIRDLGFTIFLLHHTPKSNDRIYKGSTAILDLSDHVLSLYKVNKPDSEDEDDSGQCYRFGTKDKTRYEPFHIFLTFGPEQGFTEAQDPDTEAMENLRKVMAELEKQNEHPPNQSEVIKKAKEDFDLSPGWTRKMLTKGEGTYWTMEKGGIRNKKAYHPVF